MAKSLRLKLKNKKGFTLVEMIVVIAIIAILIALLAPNVARMIENAQRTADAAKAKTIMSTAQAYATEAITSNNAINGGGALTAISGNYIIHLDGNRASGSGSVSDIADQLEKFYYNLNDTGAAPNAPSYISETGNGFLPGNTLSTSASAYLLVSSEGAIMGCVFVQREGVAGTGGGSSSSALIVKGVAGESPFQDPTASPADTPFTDSSIRGRVFNPANGKIS
jgi:prepilin-type N-terminal cleavage/methylation domain